MVITSRAKIRYADMRGHQSDRQCCIDLVASLSDTVENGADEGESDGNLVEVFD